MIIAFPFPIPIAHKARECRSLESVFLIDNMPCGMLRIRWCDIFLIAHVTNEDKTGH